MTKIKCSTVHKVRSVSAIFLNSSSDPLLLLFYFNLMTLNNCNSTCLTFPTNLVCCNQYLDIG